MRVASTLFATTVTCGCMAITRGTSASSTFGTTAFSPLFPIATTNRKKRTKSLERRRDYHDSALNAIHNDDADFMTSLQTRMTQLKMKDDTLPLVRMDCILPRQVLRVRINDASIIQLVQKIWRDETPTFGMHGTTTTIHGETIDLTNGVEVEIIERPHFIENGGVLLMLKGKRRFQVESASDEDADGSRRAYVTFLDFKEQERQEMEVEAKTKVNAMRSSSSSLTASSTTSTSFSTFRPEDDTICIAKAVLKAAELTGLIERWISLARQCELRPGQIDLLLEDIGPVSPPAYEPSERAFWVGALINPLPELGVAKGVRPALLMATSAQERVDVAYDGILESIRHMNGSAPLW